MLEFDYYGKQGDGVVNINEGYQCTLLDGTEGTKTSLFTTRVMKDESSEDPGT